MVKDKKPYRDIVTEVSNILGQKKISWSRSVELCKKAMEDGFTREDFILAANNMCAGDKRFWSIYSVFMKTDYWMAHGKKESGLPKGVWM